jgi:hypothetical protein
VGQGLSLSGTRAMKSCTWLQLSIHAVSGQGSHEHDLLSMGICMYCGRDIAAYSDDRRQHHVSKCLDEYEKLYPPIPRSPQQPADSGMGHRRY